MVARTAVSPRARRVRRRRGPGGRKHVERPHPLRLVPLERRAFSPRSRSPGWRGHGVLRRREGTGRRDPLLRSLARVGAPRRRTHDAPLPPLATGVAGKQRSSHRTAHPYVRPIAPCRTRHSPRTSRGCLAGHLLRSRTVDAVAVGTRACRERTRADRRRRGCRNDTPLVIVSAPVALAGATPVRPRRETWDYGRSSGRRAGAV